MSVQTQTQPPPPTANGHVNGHANGHTTGTNGTTPTATTAGQSEDRSDRVLSSSGWSKLGKNYNVNAGPQAATQFIHVEYMEEFVFPRIDAHLAAHESAPPAAKLRILNLAAGTGAELELILKRYWEGQDQATKDRVGAALDIVVSDAAEGMLDVAKTVIERHQAHDIAKAQIVDAQVGRGGRAMQLS